MAERFANEALSLSYLFDLKIQHVLVFNQLSKLAFLRRDLNSENYYTTQSMQLSDSMLNETIQKNTMELKKR